MTEYMVTFQPEGKRVKVEKHQTIWEAALIGGIDLTSICGGAGKCGKCKVIIQKMNNVNDANEKEKQVLSTGELKKGVRLACQAQIMGDLIVRIPQFSRTGRQRLQIEGIETPIKLEPTVKKLYIELEKPTLDDLKSDADRIEDHLQNQFKLSDLRIDFELLKELSERIRKNDLKVTIVLWDDEIVAIEPGNTQDRLFGYAVDIGTTKLAGYLIDLNSAKVLAAGSLMNPQIPFGEDVISRINHPEQSKLHGVLVKGINEILKDLQEKTGVTEDNIYEMTAVGNTVMHHLFLDLSTKYLGLSPYPPVIKHPVIINSKEIGVAIHPQGKIFFLPLIAGFVGADAVGVILASEIHKRDEICLALDIGTNTEVVLGNRDKLMACSCASGPAFEGAHVKCGMRAASGAIEKISIKPDTLEVRFKSIDNAPPVGICGSGMIDLLAEMLNAGIVDIRGAFNKKLENPRVRSGDNGMELLIVPANESGTQNDIVFTQKDVRQITLAKAAMNSGITILMQKYDINKDKIKRLFIAGAFGSHINKESARTIGIFPEVNLEIITPIGNAAGTGARMCLVSSEAKKMAEVVSKRVEYVELAAEKNFQNVFLNASYIPNADLGAYPETSQMLKKYGNYPKKLPHLFDV